MWRLQQVRRRGSSFISSCVVKQQRNLSTEEKLFDKVLIANRGEISCRVIRTCKRLGIKTVAVYSEPDVNSVAVKMADEAVCIGPAASVDSYLNIQNIMAAVKATGAQAVHPGYGFLSENKDFCEILDKENIVFIGPGHRAIQAMGDKIESKQIAIDAGVNTIPGFQGVIQDEAEVIKVSNEIGYPVMIKASAGGGGKGMRVAYNDDEAKIGYRLSKEEAASSFGDDRIFIEKFIEDPRHIEIQLIADKHGNVLPLPERECSIQRRNQKVIEEAPSVLLDDETRRAMGEQAAMLARAVDYHSAGTVEFLCDKDKNFYFLEMNTRLQVEHPVTELISNVDLVEQMLRIAAGHRIPAELLDRPVAINGWAMESRVYAEDPLRGFLPSIGRLLKYSEPKDLPGVRVDSGVTEGSDISMFYDPMISKLITHGKDRAECLDRMKSALDNYVIRGPGHNLSFLHDVYRHPRFESGQLTTKFIDEEYPDGFSGVQLTRDEKKELLASSVWMQLANQRIARTISGQMPPLNHHRPSSEQPMTTTDVPVVEKLDTGVFRTSLSAEEAVQAIPETEFESLYIGLDGPFGATTHARVLRLMDDDDSTERLIVKMDDEVITIEEVDWKSRGAMFKARINGRPVAIQVLGSHPTGFDVQFHGALHQMVVRSAQEEQYAHHMIPKPEIDTSRLLQCPMPGMLISVAVSEGEKVEIGQELAVVEAMKMQNVLTAEKSGRIAAIHQQAGDSLKVDDVILEFE